MHRPTPSWYLASNPLFARVHAAALARFDTEDHWCQIAGGQMLFRQGDPADALYLVVRGSLRVIVENSDGRERVVDTLGRGALVGEMALLLDDTRTATVVARRDSELVRIDKAEFDRLIEAYPSIAVGIARMLGARLKRTTRLAGDDSRIRTIALLPIAPGTASGFGERLMAALITELGLARERAEQEIALVTADQVDREHPGGANADPEEEEDAGGLVRWMSGLEERYRYVIVEADPVRPHWTRRCLGQADVILLVARAQDDPRRGAIEDTYLPEHGRSAPAARGTPRELVLLHDAATTRITGTAHWLAPRLLARHHHIRAGCDEDCRRVARFLTGRAVGLVLSGGGARGFAHIGVIKALRAHGWPIDVIGGASMGAIIAAQYASGRRVDEIVETTRREFAGRQERDLTLPIVSLFSAAATVRKMKRLFGDANIEDLPVGFFCTTTNLSRAESVIHDRGPVWLWTRTSCAIPGLAPPVPFAGDLLVDGGLLNNLPADVMRERCEGLVVGVDVTSGVDLRSSAEDRPSVSGWPIFWERVTRGAAKTPAFPTIVDILSRTALVGSIRDAARMAAHCDLYLQPLVEQFAMTDFHEIDALVEAGYVATERALADAHVTAPAAPS